MIRAERLVWNPGAPILDGFSIAVAPGLVTSLVGPSGCGKSSLLRVLAGLRPLDGGVLEGVPRRKAFVFQDPALLPWLTTRENVALPGRYLGRISPGALDEALARVGLEDHGDKLPAQLSGGQRMRASLARALVSRPDLVLLDEPFAALDGLTRRKVQDMFEELQLEQRWTVLLVTHEPADAVRLADRVVALAGPPLRIVDQFALFAPRPRGLADGASVERILAALEG